MKSSFANFLSSRIWSSDGSIGRGSYALIGFVGFAIKYNLDRVVAVFGFHRHWNLSNYWIPVKDVANVTMVRGSEARFLATMVLLALPFVWVGVAQTMKRLRSAGLPAFLVLLFFAPFVNVFFFLFLCLYPERKIDSGIQEKIPTQAQPFVHFIPESAWGSAAISLVFTIPFGLGMVWLGTNTLTHYGWGLFVAVPFVMGFTAALIYGWRVERSLWASLLVGCAAVSLLGLGLIAFAIEGAICLIFLIPLALPVAVLGAYCAWVMHRQRWFHRGAPAFLAALIVFVPGMQYGEHALVVQRPTFVVKTAIDIQAPPEKVWQQVIAFSQIPPPTEVLFRAGIAYPMRAEISGTGPGAVRHCVFSTGAFIEPIKIWDEPHLLKFSVISNPPPMEEWTPYSHIDTPHLHGFLVSEGGQFLLTPLPNGGTRLEGTTWYQHGLWPAQYWRLWSDLIIHKIHMRVLNHIKDEVEDPAK
jgi:uncharacterized membrane protein YhaH (DUF805 family)